MKRSMKHPQLFGTRPDKCEAKALLDTNLLGHTAPWALHLCQESILRDILQDRSNLKSQTQVILQDLFSEQCGKVAACITIY